MRTSSTTTKGANKPSTSEQRIKAAPRVAPRTEENPPESGPRLTAAPANGDEGLIEELSRHIRRAMGHTQVALGYAEHAGYAIDPKYIRRIATALRRTVDILDALEPGQ
jgi:hypothetical protein